MEQNRTDIKTPEFVSLQFQVAGLGSRASAFIIDQLLLWAFNAIVIIILVVILRNTSPLPFISEFNDVPLAVTIIGLFIINWGYFFIAEFFLGGRTVGKKAMGIRVIQENGHSITLLSSFIRNFFRLIDSLPIGYFVGMMMVFFHSKHKRVGDLVAGTIVVHERKAKSSKKLTPLEREINNRGLSMELLPIDEWTLKSFGTKEWKLVATYCSRFHHVSNDERMVLTKQIAEILLPKLGLEIENKSIEELENLLIVLYLNLKDEWEFEL